MGNKTIAIAGPGTGKTTFLVQKAAEALSEDNCCGIIISTFTKKAAKELEEKIRQEISDNALALSKNILTGTIHSVCYQLLNLYTDTAAFEIIPEDKLISFIHSRIDALGFQAEEIKKSGWEIASELVGIYSMLTDLEADLTEFNLDDPHLNTVIPSYSRYRNILSRNRLYDFATLQETTLNQLKNNNEFLNRIHNDYNYFFIDEFQDVNNIQNKIFDCLSSGDSNLIVVGDDDQSIYGFRGADRSQIVNFEINNKNVKRVELFRNYRSTKNIVSASSYFINLSNQNRLNKQIVSHRNVTGCLVSLLDFESDSKEYSFIAKKINQLVTEFNFKFSDIAILMTSVKRDSEIIKQELAKHSIPHQFSALGGLFKTIYSLEFLALMDLFLTKDEEAKEQFMSTISSLDEDLHKFHKNNNSVEKITRLDELSSCTALIYKLFELTDFIHRYENYAENMGTLTDLATSFDEFTPNYDAFRFYSYLQYLKRKNQVDEIHRQSDSVQVMTIHQSKGLEFPIVFLTSMNKYKKPTSKIDLMRTNLTGSKLNEERNIFYVAMTRAEEKLFISRHIIKEQKAKLARERGRNPYKYEPNRFFHELSSKFKTPKNHLNSRQLSKRRRTGEENLQNEEELVLSYSNLKTYWTCPKQYQYQNIYRLQTLQLGGLFFGANLHRIIENILRKIALETFDEEQLDTIIDENWSNNPVLRPSENRRYRQTGKQQLLGFIDDFCNSITSDQIVAIEKPFEILISKNVKLKGRYDAIIRFNDQPTILDFKTGDISEEDIQKQLSMYKLTYEKENSEDVDTAIYSLKQTSLKMAVVDDRESVLDELLTASKCIMNNDFQATPGRCCQDCAYRRLCKDSV